MVDTGAAVLELDYKCDLPAIKAATAGRTTVLGVVDPSEVIARATPAAVAEAVRAATDHELGVQTRLRRTEDFKEGIAATHDRREPVFKGR